MSTLAELGEICVELAVLMEQAANNLETNPCLSMEKLKIWTRGLIRILLAFEGVTEPKDDADSSRLNLLSNRGLLPSELLPFFYVIQDKGTDDTWPPEAEKKRASLCMKPAAHLAIWFVKSYGPHLTQHTANSADIESIIQSIRKTPPADSVRHSVRKVASRRANTLKLTEEETRVIIDYQLRSTGWQADSWALRYSLGARPEKSVNKAIAEWPTASGPADYAMFAGLDFIGLVEAKKIGKDVLSDLIQGKRYSRDAQLDGQARFVGGPWGEYKVPFLFATNARPYLEQLKEKSGIWFLDARVSTNHPRPLQGWYSAEGLVALQAQDIAAAHAELAKEPLDYLGLRDYQKIAVTQIEAALDQGKSRLLVAMATGTGKTRLALSLIYRLIKSGRFRRILFVVDRTALGEQAGDKFKETRLEELKTFDQIYDLKEVDKIDIEPTTKVNIATVQSLMRAIMYPSETRKTPSVGQYDCIIVDEAHRGYTLDRELGEDELPYRDQSDFLSKYRRVIEHFDAVKIGLTATPAPHTIEIFGRPVYTYSYREAVVDGWLMDHEPPHQLLTNLAKDGIKWEKGDTIPVYDPATGQITNIEDIPDEVKLEIDHFNKLVLTKPFNRTVIKELVKHLNPDGEAKTLIFAATDDHADMVVQLLKEEFEAAGVPVTDDAIVKITGSIDRPEGMIRKYKNERLPNIVVTVDLLTTGVDVPEICNLVFIRRVRSRILFEQMLGRATRLCDRIQKTHFTVFDTVRIYEALSPVSAMKPVAANPAASLGQLADALEHMAEDKVDSAVLKNQVEQILAKLHRMIKRLDADGQAEFKTLSGGQSVQQFINELKGVSPDVCNQKLAERKILLAFLDENRHRQKQQLISNHPDELHSHTRGYGDAKKPEDYLNAFREFIITHMNKIPALAIVCQRPRDLTRKALKELKLALDQAGFTEKNLQVAWKDWKNEDIAADIISFIRRQAMGDPLVSHQDRIQKAMSHIYTMRDWTAVQRQWLERIEKQLLTQTVLDHEDFNRGAFAAHGGFNRLNKIFQGNFQQVLDDITLTLYPEGRESA
ncbi:MAG: type I restriction-modification system endonuclease [Desulfobacteraceae bacterium]|nr:MAG: type I restriction-modification system endonuclease [Desulfobacteraceae bacterium]